MVLGIMRTWSVAAGDATSIPCLGGRPFDMGRFLEKQLVRETRRGRVDRVEELLGKGAGLERLGSDGFTPLMRAAYAGHGDLVGMLLRRAADPNTVAGDGASALFWACARGHAAVAGMLIAAGADVNAVRDGGPSVLNIAIRSQAPAELVRALLKAGASVEHRYLGKDMAGYADWCGRGDLVPILKPRHPRLAGRRTR
jgi:ankyrin repeat protein